MVKTQFQLIDCDLVLNQQVILRDVSVQLPLHCLNHIKGDNGSGKTCLISLLLNLYTVSKGKQIIRYNKKDVCYIPAQHLFFDNETVAHAMFFYRKLYGPDILLGFPLLDMSYDTLKHKKVCELSSGMKQKLQVLPLFLDFEHYFLDEITQNLDSHTMHCLNQRINELLFQNKTVTLIDHNHAFIESLKYSRKEDLLCANKTVKNISYSV